MIAENINNIHEKITAICQKCGRDVSEIKIIGVSKNTGIESIKEAVKSGIINLGESKAQELKEKSEILDDNIIWHFIGHLQKNKTKNVVNYAEYIHSVDSVKLAEEINKQALKKNKIQKILIEVKTSDEDEKYGITELGELLQVAEYCSNSSNIEFCGLMTIAPFSAEEKIIRKSFLELRKLRTTLQEQGFNINELSMGMTNDYEIAIEEGATMIRIGTAIFGERDYSKSWKEQ